MESFDINIKLDYDSLKLNKLLKDAQSKNLINPTTSSTTASFDTTTAPLTDGNKAAIHDVETLDLSAEVEKSDSFSSANIKNERSSFESNVEINGEKTSPLGTTEVSENKEMTKIESSESSSNNFFDKNQNNTPISSKENLGDSKIDITANSADQNSTRRIENKEFSMNNTTSPTKTVSNHSMNQTTTEENNKSFSSSLTSENKIFSNTSEIDSNSSSKITVAESTKNETVSDTEIYEYRNTLVEYGITEKDINRILAGDITIEELMTEIENDPNTTRKRSLLESSYLKAYNLEYKNMEDLKKEISTLDEKIDELFKKRNNLGNRDFVTGPIDQEILKLQQKKDSYQYIYENIDREVGNYLENISPYLEEKDFFQKAKFNNNCLKIVKELEKEYSFATIGTYDKPVVDVLLSDEKQLAALLSCMINNKGNISEGYFKNENGVIFHLQSKDELLEHYAKWAPLMTEEEVATFNYLYNQKGEEASFQFLNDLADKLDNRYLMKKIEEDSDYAKNHPVLASVGSVAITPLEGLNAVKYSIHLGKEIKRTDVYSTGNIWRNKVGQELAEEHGEGLAFLYGTGMSMVDSASLIGVSIATGGVATPVISATIMGSRAYVSTINDALDRGLSNSSAIALAFSSAVVETAMESISVSHLLNLEQKLGKNTIHLTQKIANKIENPTLAKLTSKGFYIGASALSQGLVEGEEEFATEILNYVADIFIAKDLSDYTMTMNRYLKEGCTETQALTKTMKEFSKQATSAFLGGFISGVCFGTLSSSITTHQSSDKMATSITEQYTNNLGQENNRKMTKEEANKNLDIILSHLDYYHPKKGLDYLRAYAKTGDMNYIVNDASIRNLIKTIPMDEINAYIDHKTSQYTHMTDQEINKNLDIILSHLDYYYPKKGLDYLRAYTQTGNMNYIVNDASIRSLIKTIPMDKINTYIENKIASNRENQDISQPEDKNQGINLTNQNEEMYKFFEMIEKNTGQYGVDQADIEKLCYYTLGNRRFDYREAKEIVNNAREENQALPHFTKYGLDEYKRLKQKMVDQGFSNRDASIILSSINDAGACSYASVCNNLMYQFRGNISLYEKTFGYPMFRVENGKTYLNSAELLLDMYLFANTKGNGGYFIKNNRINPRYISNTIDVYGRKILNAKEQVYLSSGLGRNGKTIRNFLKSKNKNIIYKTKVVFDNFRNKTYTSSERQRILKMLKEEVEKGSDLSLDYFYHKDHIIRMLSYDKYKYSDMSTAVWHEGGGHSVAITKIDDEGFVVSSWGQKYLIPYEDLFNGGRFTISKNNMSILID